MAQSPQQPANASGAKKMRQYGTLNTKWTGSAGGSSKVEINLAQPKVGRFS